MKNSKTSLKICFVSKHNSHVIQDVTLSIDVAENLYKESAVIIKIINIDRKVMLNTDIQVKF